MKKLISLLLVFMLSCTSALAVAAFDEDRFGEKVIIGDTSNGYTIYTHYGPISPMVPMEPIGKYVFEGANWMSTAPFDSNLGIYVEKGDELYSLALAYEAGVIDIDEAAKKIDRFDLGITGFGAVLIGDLNRSGSVDMKDVLTVQKAIAKFTSDAGLIPYADCDKNEEITVNDVLLMQKVIANMYEII